MYLGSHAGVPSILDQSINFLGGQIATGSDSVRPETNFVAH
jgi:hypothetical protein